MAGLYRRAALLLPPGRQKDDRHKSANEDQGKRQDLQAIATRPIRAGRGDQDEEVMIFHSERAYGVPA